MQMFVCMYIKVDTHIPCDHTWKQWHPKSNEHT